MTERNFQRVLSAAADKGQEHVLALLDVDHFRALKNLHGHDAGESLVRTLCKRLNHQASICGGKMARLSADEFAILVPVSACGGGVEDWARSLVLAASLPFSHRGVGFTFGVSAGIAVFPGQGGTSDNVLRCARLAITQGKRAGGSKVTTCTLRQFTEVLERREITRDLPSGIANGQLVPYYQPVISLTSGNITGMEVLARWLHPRHGLLEPVSFIQFAEENGLCLPLAKSLLSQVRHDAADWPEAWSFAVNTVPDDLPAVLDFLVSSERRSIGLIWPTRIELEVTETALMRDVELSRRAIGAMRPFGIKVVLDDFGSGYANFRQLRQVPFSRLKIDKSLITDMLDDNRAQPCVQSIIDLGHSLDMMVTAEGVECAAVANRLGNMGCDHAQGYHFGRAMPAAAVNELALNWGKSGPALSVAA